MYSSISALPRGHLVLHGEQESTLGSSCLGTRYSQPWFRWRFWSLVLVDSHLCAAAPRPPIARTGGVRRKGTPLNLILNLNLILSRLRISFGDRDKICKRRHHDAEVLLCALDQLHRVRVGAARRLHAATHAQGRDRAHGTGPASSPVPASVRRREHADTARP